MNALQLTDLRVIDGDAEPRVLDLRLGERLEFKAPRQIRELIERNQQELERYGHVARYDVVRPQGGGTPAREYLLNEAQALLICMKSETPVAADIRHEIITVFLAWRRGQPVPSGIGDLFHRAIEPVRLVATETRDLIRDNVIPLNREIRDRIDDVVPRHDFSPSTLKVWTLVIHKYYDGMCPSGCSIRIERDFTRLPKVWTEDHWYTRERNGTADGWPVAALVNEKLKDRAFRDTMQKKFDTFHGNLERVQNKHIDKLFDEIRADEPEYIAWRKPGDLFDPDR
jgi:hypothetical protein